MDYNGKQGHPRMLPPLTTNRIAPATERINTENEELIQEGFKSEYEYPQTKAIQGIRQSKQTPHVIEQPPAVIKNLDKTIEGKFCQWDETFFDENQQHEWDFFILKDHALSLYKGDSNKGKLKHKFTFSKSEEYRFINPDERRLIITDKDGQKISLIIQDKQSYLNILMEWYNIKLLSDFTKYPQTTIVFPQQGMEMYSTNCTFTFNPLSSSEFGNIYHEKYMNPYQTYSNIAGKPEIKIGVDFKHKYRPNKMMQISEKDYENRKVHKWVPSRDWSRLFVLSTIKIKSRYGSYSYSYSQLCLEIYNFNLQEEKNIQSSPKRINYLSQLLRPQRLEHIEYIEDDKPIKNVLLQVSFTGDRLSLLINDHEMYFIKFNRNWSIQNKKKAKLFNNGIKIDNISIFQSHFMIKLNGIYYQSIDVIEIIERYQTRIDWALADKFKETAYKNIIHCGIYDILITTDNKIIIFNNINPSNEFNNHQEEELVLLHNEKHFIQLDDHSIAFLSQPLKADGNKIQIIDILQDRLVKRGREQVIQLISPSWENLSFLDCEFNLIKFKENEYAALIVSSSKNQEEFQFQYYRLEGDQYKLSIQKRLKEKDYIYLYQIPHLPFVTLNGNLFLNCDMYHKNNLLELDIESDETKILQLDQFNFLSYELQIYNSSFKEISSRFIKEKFNINEETDKSDYIEIPGLKTLLNIRQRGENFSISIFQPSQSFITHLDLLRQTRYLTHQVIQEQLGYYVSIILLKEEQSIVEVQLQFTEELYSQCQIYNIGLLNSAKFHIIKQQYDNLSLSFVYNVLDETSGQLMFANYAKSLQKSVVWECIDTFKFEKKEVYAEEDLKKLVTIIQILASGQSIKILDSKLSEFQSIIEIKTKIKVDAKTQIFAIPSNIFIFSQDENLRIFDLQLQPTHDITLGQDAIFAGITYSYDTKVIECIDANQIKFPFLIKLDSQNPTKFNMYLNSYPYNSSYPKPIQSELHKNFFTHVDLVTGYIYFFRSFEEKVNQDFIQRIKLITNQDKQIQEIIDSQAKKFIKEKLKECDILLLFSYNVDKRSNLITEADKHEEKDYIYSELFKKLQLADSNDLPVLIYNTSQDYNIHENIIDVLLKNNAAINLAQLILKLAFRQDTNGKIYSNLNRYLQYLNANELEVFIGSQIFFYTISTKWYKEYQNDGEKRFMTAKQFNTYSKIKKNLKDIIEPASLTREQLSNGEFQIEYSVINMMQLITSEDGSEHPHRIVVQNLKKLVEKDPTILERESIQLIIDFKWQSYTFRFFVAQLILFSCFIIAFIYDIVAVSKNPHAFENNDSNQVIPRYISLAIIILFGIYEFANIVQGIRKSKKYSDLSQDINDLVLIEVYILYFIMAFTNQDQEYALKILQLLVVILTFIKFIFLIRIYPKVSFLVRMLVDVFFELRIFFFVFLLVIGFLTVMAQIIIDDIGDDYKGIKAIAIFVIVFRESIGDYDTSSIIEGTQDFKILAWLLWLLILVIGNIVFMNFIIAVVSETYEHCMEQKTQLIYKAKLEMIEECEDLMPDQLFQNANLFPQLIIVRREKGSTKGEEASDEWMGFVKQIKRHLDRETTKIYDNISNSTDSTTKKLEASEKEQRDIANKIENKIDEMNNKFSAMFQDLKAAIQAK